MGLRKSSCWAVLIAVGCNGKLIVDRGDEPASGAGGGAANAGSAPLEARAGRAGASELEGGNQGGDGGGGDGGREIPPDTGKIGQKCIPDALLTESEGNAAEAVIKTLARCDEGLACNAQGECIAAPDCQHGSGLCVVWQIEPGTSEDDIAARRGIGALAANESHVYWLEYGTRDALGNHQHDGALMAYAIADGTTTAVASGLSGPVRLGLTTTHAYLSVDGGPLLGSLSAPLIHPQLFRVPLIGGGLELVQEGSELQLFAGSGSQAFWSGSGGIYSMSSEVNAVPSLFIEVDDNDDDYVSHMVSDATDLYYLSKRAVMRTPVTSAAPRATGASAPFELALHDDGLFSLETLGQGSIGHLPSGVLLSRAAKSGGEFQQVRPLGAGIALALQAAGDRYFYEVRAWAQGKDGEYAQRRVLTARFADSDPPIRLLERGEQPPGIVDPRWVGTSSDLYWSDGQTLYKQPLPTR